MHITQRSHLLFLILERSCSFLILFIRAFLPQLDFTEHLCSMTAPDSPPSSGLFLSSSPIHYGTGPDEEVERIVREAQRIDSIEPSIESILRRHSEAFVDTLERQVQLIKSRSQDFRDCQITVFDKALLVLTRNGGELHHASAVTFFCKEFLGVSSNANLLQKQFALLAVSLTPAQGERTWHPCFEVSRINVPKSQLLQRPNEDLFRHKAQEAHLQERSKYSRRTRMSRNQHASSPSQYRSTVPPAVFGWSTRRLKTISIRLMIQAA